MSLDKLKPSTKSAGGKRAPCERCGLPDVEYVSVNMQLCPRCDPMPVPKVAKPPAKLALPPPDDDEPDTNPGWAHPHPIYYPTTTTFARLYKCATCNGVDRYLQHEVAQGKRCPLPHPTQMTACGGYLRVYP